MNGRQEKKLSENSDKLLELESICSKLAVKIAELEASIVTMKPKKPGRPRRETHEIQ